MSAIWGYVDLNQDLANDKIANSMKNAFAIYKIDRSEHLLHNNAIMGCEHQHIGPAAASAVLPYADDKNGFIFTADCILDNRAELKNIFDMPQQTVPDAELFVKAYQKWGKDCVRHLRGSFSVAVYDTASNSLFLAADQVFSRSIYYYRCKGKIYFSTIINAIIDALEVKPKINERWISDYLSINFLGFISEPVETPWEGICKLEAGQYAIFTEENTSLTEYYSPFDAPKLKLKSDEEYKKLFLNIMDTASAEISDLNEKTGIYISGGLDSTGVAASVIPFLREKGEKLYGYTSVPVRDYKANDSKHSIQDETSDVKKFAEMYPDFVANFCSVPQTNALDGTAKIIQGYEIPCKSVSNISWMMGIAEEMQKDQCRIVLNGQMGNLTISWGNLMYVSYLYLKNGHPVKAMQTINDYGKRNKVSRKFLLKLFIDYAKDKKKSADENEDIIKNTYVNKEFSRKNDSPTRLKKKGMFLGATVPSTLLGANQAKYNKNILSVSGETETKLGLLNGFVVRDISKDIRVFEFCLTAPLKCFVYDGTERRLIRGYMKDRLPKEITDNMHRRGEQSADWHHRLAKDWQRVYKELEASVFAPEILPYIDIEAVREDLLKNEKEVYTGESEFMLQNLFYVHILSEFIRQYSK